MVWYEVVVLIASTFGGVSGGVALYKARAEKTGLDVSNFNAMLKSLMGRCDALEKQITLDREQSHKYVMELRTNQETQDSVISDLKNSVHALERTVTMAYRCKFPENIQDCPVVHAYEEKLCNSCKPVSRQKEDLK